VSSPAQLILSRLDGVRQSGAGWCAICPAHEDRTPSLSVSEGHNGAALLHCFGGCDAADVLGAIGLTLADLFPAPVRHITREGRRAALDGYKRTALLAAIGVAAREATVAAITARAIERREPLTPEDIARVQVAAIRLRDAREVLLS
jgi:hypothetical protein